MLVRIVGRDLPGTRMVEPLHGVEVRENVHVGLQVRRDPEQVVRADADRVTFETEVAVVGDDFRGPAVQGRRGDRFLYVTWGSVADDGAFAMFRRLKLWLSGTPAEVVAAADQPGQALQIELGLTDAHGCPLCGGLRAATGLWRAVPA